MRTMTKLIRALALSAVVLSTAGVGSAAADVHPSTGRLLVSGLQGPIGGAIGPDGALYVAEGLTGEITRVDPRTGATSTFADGLPKRVIGVGGAMDVAFVGRTAYALVTLVSPDVGGSDVDGIYRIDGAHSSTVIADIGQWSTDHPPRTAFDVPSGVQFALEAVPGGFLVSDGHHNRVLKVSRDGDISQLIQVDNVVPTGMAIRGDTVYAAEAGPVPHRPADGKLVRFDRRRGGPAHVVASGFSLMVDAELGPDHALYGLSQGDSPGNVAPGSPAKPDSGELLRIDDDGTFDVLVSKLDLPTSVHFVGDAALVVTLNGEVWRINDVADD
jgi:hypothetical protein